MTDAAHRLVMALRAERPRLRWPGTPDPRTEVLEALAALAEPDTLPHIRGLLFEGGRVGLAAAKAAEAIVETVPAGALSELETRLRHWGWGADDRPWNGLTPRTLDHWAPAGSPRVPYFGIASFHRSGYVREAATHGLAREGSGREIPFLVLRLNDWVGPVRRAAEAAVRERLTDAHAAAWAAALPLVLGLGDRDRHDMPDLGDLVIGLLARAQNADALRAALTSEDRSVRRAASRLALAAGGAVAHRAARHALDTPDGVVRLGVARALRVGEVADEGLEAALLRDPAHGVRREVLLGLVEREAPGADAALRTAFLDAHRSIRHLARYFIQKRSADPVDVAARTRDALSDADDAASLRAALGSLGETGGVPDAALALPHLADDRPSVRLAALGAVVALDAEGHARAILDAFGDPSPRVARAAARAVADDLPGVDAEAEFARALSEAAPHVRTEALRALATLPFWSALPHLLRATAQPDAALREQALDHLARWLALSVRVYVAPTAVQAEAARSAARDAPIPVALRAEVVAVVERLSR